MGAGRGLAPAAPSVVVAPRSSTCARTSASPAARKPRSFATGLAAAAHGGFGFVATMADTRPPVDRPEVVQRVLAAAAATALGGPHPAVGAR